MALEVAVLPLVFDQPVDDRAGGGRLLLVEADRVGLQRQRIAVRPDQLVLVNLAPTNLGNEQLPHAAFVALAHDVAATVPGIEIADNRYAACRRRKDGEGRALDAVHRHGMRPELVVEPVVVAFGDQVDVRFAKDRSEAIGIALVPAVLTMGIQHLIGVVGADLRHVAGEESRRAESLQGTEFTPARVDDARALGAGAIDAHDRAVFGGKAAEDCEGIAMDAAADLEGFVLGRAMVDRAGCSGRGLGGRGHFRTCRFVSSAMIPRKGIDSQPGRMADSYLSS